MPIDYDTILVRQNPDLKEVEAIIVPPGGLSRVGSGNWTPPDEEPIPGGPDCNDCSCLEYAQANPVECGWFQCPDGSYAQTEADCGDSGGGGGGGGGVICPDTYECEPTSCTAYFDDLTAGDIPGGIALTLGANNNVVSNGAGNPLESVTNPDDGFDYLTNAAGAPSSVRAFTLQSAQVAEYDRPVTGELLCADITDPFGIGARTSTGEKILFQPLDSLDFSDMPVLSSPSSESFEPEGWSLLDEGEFLPANTAPDHQFSFYLELETDVTDLRFQSGGIYNYWTETGSRHQALAFNSGEFRLNTVTGQLTVLPIDKPSYVLQGPVGYENWRGWWTYERYSSTKVFYGCTPGTGSGTGNPCDPVPDHQFACNHVFRAPNGLQWGQFRQSSYAGPLYGAISGDIYGQQPGLDFRASNGTERNNSPIIALHAGPIDDRERIRFEQLFGYYSPPDNELCQQCYEGGA